MKSNLKATRPFLLVAFGVLFGLGLVVAQGGMSKLNIAFGAGDVMELGGPTPNIPEAAGLQQMNNAFRAIAKAIQPTVVSINVKTEAPKRSSKKGGGSDNGGQMDPNNPFHFFFNNPGDDDEDGSGGGFPFPFGNQGPSEGLGSGVIITSDGYILTNNHVVADAAKKGGVTVKLNDKRTFEGRVVGTDPTTDLAVVKIEASGLPVAALGNSEDVQIGDWVLAVGNPLGLESTVTKGIVSSMGRKLDMPIQGNSKDGGYSIADFIQTDAAINPGNSGGGLFNVKGQIIGINAAIATRTGMFAGYGFAIPVNLAKVVATDLIKNGKVNRGYIGVNIRPVDATDAEALGLGSPRGVRIENTVKGGAGAEAGLKPNDIILSVDGHETNEPNQLQGMIAMHHVGDLVKLHIWRSGSEIDLSVRLRGRDNDIALNDEQPDENINKREVINEKEVATLDNIGVSVRNLTGADKDKYHVTYGVYVTNVQMASESYDRGIGAIGKVITEVAHKPVRNVIEFENAINAARGKAIGLTVRDDQGSDRFVSMKVPKD